MSSTQELFEIIAEFRFWQGREQTLERRFDGFIEHNPADGQAVRINFGGHRDAAESTVPIYYFGFRDFGKVMIFGSNPKHRDRLDSALSHALSEFYRREGFIDRIERAGEKPGLLSRDDGDAIFFAQLLNVSQSLVRSAPLAIHLLERIAYFGAIGFVIGQHAFASLGNFVVAPHGFRIEASQGD